MKELSMLDIIILLIAVAFILVRLYSVFGKNNDDIKIVLKPLDKEQERELAQHLEKLQTGKQGHLIKLTEPKKPLEQDLTDGFNKEMFLNGAGKVFEMVLSAFNEGNLLPIKGLVSKKIYDALSAAVKARKADNLTAEVDFIGFAKREIKDIKKLKNSMKVVVEFVSEQVNLLKNSKGEVIEGDENFVQKITDMWTFERPLNAKNNSWILVSTKKTA